MNAVAPVKVSFKEQMHRAREDAIIQTVNRFLAEKGFDAMTVDEVASAVGIAKASLYKHFPSKEDLAAAAMVRVLHRTQAFLETIAADQKPVQKLREAVRWAMQVQLAGEMPHLPSQNSTLRTTLLANREYLDGLMTVSDLLGGWIEAAQADGSLNAALPPIAVLYTLFARACDRCWNSSRWAASTPMRRSSTLCWPPASRDWPRAERPVQRGTSTVKRGRKASCSPLPA